MIEGRKRASNLDSDVDQLPVPKQTFLGNSWLTSVQAMATVLASKLNANYIGFVKTAHSFNPKQFLEETMHAWPSRSHYLVIESTHPNGVKLVAVG